MPIYVAAWAQMIDMAKLQSLKPDTIVYSVEELKELLFTV
jgi:hypothetical protein